MLFNRIVKTLGVGQSVVTTDKKFKTKEICNIFCHETECLISKDSLK